MNKKVKGVVIFLSVLMVFALMVAIVVAKNNDNSPKVINSNVSLTFLDQQPVLGNETAPVSIVEFGDFKCPGCKYFAKNVYPNIVRDFVDTGKANFKFVNFPFLAPDSLTAAAAGEYVAKNSPKDFWLYFEEIYENQKKESENWASIEFMIELAKKAKIGVNYDEMEKSLRSGEFSEVVNKDLEFSRALGIRQTPTLVVNGILIATGGLSYDQIRKAINDAINNKVAEGSYEKK